ncbi:MAG: CopG family transcriptional regulator, partial [Clostridia bacterium]|nr:CopG family transcriptional regulator [Clostridia bacterium]
QNRSEFIREAMKLYLRERKKIRIREMMKKGYMEMGMINLEISEVGVEEDRLILEKYEKILAESE